MNVARTSYFVTMVTIATLCKALDSTHEQSLTSFHEYGGIGKKMSFAVSPLTWRCKIDKLGAADYECDDWAHSNDTFYIVHGGVCRVHRNDQTLQMICQRGKWTGTDIMKKKTSRQKRWWWHHHHHHHHDKATPAPRIVYHTVYQPSEPIYRYITNTVTRYVTKKPPRFTVCRPSNLMQEYYTPAGRDSVTVTWTVPTATDDDGTVQSVQQVFGNPRGGSFEGSSDTDGKQHTILYEARDNDGLTATCYFAFKVRVRTCGALSWPAHGIRNCPNGQTLGRECTYSCNRGYQLSGPSKVACQGGNNTSWSAAPTCDEVSCGSPPNVKGGNVTCAGTTYGSYCGMSCPTGFDLHGQVFTRCQHNGTWFWGDPTRCRDGIAPEITCKSPQIVYADNATSSTSVTWEEPTVSDNLDPSPIVSKISGPAQGVTIDVGRSKYVVYRATDADGNTSPQCAIELRVESTSCGHPLDTLLDGKLRFNCSMETYTYGDTCTLACSLNFPLEGPDLITCERNDTGTGKPVGYWSWENDTMPYCREMACNELGAPRDGALVADTTAGISTRTMLCNSGKDIPAMGKDFSGEFFCRDKLGWSPNMTKAPDCTETVSPRSYVLPSKFYYYNGTCNPSDTGNILNTFNSIVSSLRKTLAALCTTNTSCTVNNPEVICGPTSRRKRSDQSPTEIHQRSSSNGHDVIVGHSDKISKRETKTPILAFQFNIQTSFNSSGMTWRQKGAYADKIQLNTLLPAIKNNTRSGAYDHAQYGVLTEDAIKTAKWGTAYCAPGSIKLRNDNCNLCPRGYYEADGTCTACPVGQYSNISGSVACTSCPTGYSTRQDTSDSLENCTKLCGPGSYSPDTFAPCAPCKAGYYQPLAAQTSCVTCSPGKSTKATGSNASSDCQYFDAYVVDTAGQPIEAEIALLNEFTVSFYIKAVSGSPDMVIRVGQELEVSITDHVEIVTTSSKDLLGQTTPDTWMYVAVYWDVVGGNLTAFYGDGFVVRRSSVFPSSSPTVRHGHLSINATNLKGKGVYISGLRLQASVLDQTNNATVCQTMADDDVVSMDMFKNNTARGVALIVPSVCDVTDDCLSSPCGSHGNCFDNIGGFTCTCFGGWSGITCDSPPDFCAHNDCSSGATCVRGTEDYTCSCRPGYSGVFCETPPVDGGWDNWSKWTECTVTCNSGTQQRTRACDSPTPEAYGQDCAGNAIETESCNTDPCPECPEPKEGFGSLLDCETDPATGMKNCTPICHYGYVRPPGLETDTYKCGQETGYKWVPKRNIAGCMAPNRTKEYTMSARSSYATTIQPDDEQTVVDKVKSNLNDTACFQSTSCEVNVTVSNQIRERRKRSTGSTLTMTFTIPIVGTSDIHLDQYDENGTVSPGLQEVIHAINNLESTASAIKNSTSTFFDVTANGVTYAVDDDTLTFDASPICSAGQVVADGLCAECPVGSHQVGTYCSPCDKGTYQDQSGQSSCVQCPAGFTTETIGSDNSSECTECPVGSRQVGANCLPCDTGTYQDQTGQSSCVQCPTGFTTETIGSYSSANCSVSPSAAATSTTTLPSISTPVAPAGHTGNISTALACIGNKFLVSGPYGVGDEQLSESSYYNNKTNSVCTQGRFGKFARLNSTYPCSSWSSGIDHTDDYVQVDFRAVKLITGVVIAGRIHEPTLQPHTIQYVTSFRVLYSVDCVTFAPTLDGDGNEQSKLQENVGEGFTFQPIAYIPLGEYAESDGIIPFYTPEQWAYSIIPQPTGGKYDTTT